MGSIIERKKKDGSVSYQAMVKIPGSKAAVRSYGDKESAEKFVASIEAQRQITKAKRAPKWVEYRTPDEVAKTNQQAWENEWLKTTLGLYAASDRITNRFKQPMRTIIAFGGDMQLGELNKKWVRKYLIHARAQKTRTKEPYKWATIVDHMKIISAAINWRAEEMEARGAKLPFSFKMIPKDWETKRERRLESHEHIAIRARLKLLRSSSRTHWPRMICLALQTGARLQELVFAEWKEFDLERRYWVIPAAHTKCKTARLVPLNKAAIRALRVMALIANVDSPRVFHLLTTPKAASNTFSKITIALKIKDLRFHDLRHEAISRMVLTEKNLSVFEIMGIVGHSSIEMLRRYANLRGDELAAKLLN